MNEQRFKNSNGYGTEKNTARTNTPNSSLILAATHRVK